MKSKIKSLLLSIVGLAVLTLLIFKLDVDFPILDSIKYGHYIIIATLLFPIIPIITALRLKFLLFAIGEKTRSIQNLIVIEYVNKFLYTIAPAKLNVPAKAILLNKMCGVKMGNGASISTFEYMLDMGTTLLLAIFGVVLFFKDLQYVSLAKITLILILVFLFITIFFTLPMTIFEALLHKAECIPIPLLKKVLTNILRFIKTIRETWITLIFNKQMYYVLSTIILNWGVFVVGTELLFLSVDYSVSFLWIAAVMSCGIFVGGVTTIPGGLGVREATMVLLYGALGVPYTISTIVVLTSRLLMMIPVAIGYVLSLRLGINYFK